MLHICGLKLLENLIRMFFTNLCLSPNSAELETLVLGTRIVLNDFLFDKVFDTKFSGVNFFMNGSWPKNFDVLMKRRRLPQTLIQTPLLLVPLSISFYYRILAHIIATTLIPLKGSLSNVTCRNVFVLYCMIRKYKINWSVCIREHMVESAADSHSSAGLPYGFFITQILIYYGIDI